MIMVYDGAPITLTETTQKQKIANTWTVFVGDEGIYFLHYFFLTSIYGP